MKILLIKYGALGDVLRTTALLKPLARRYGDLELWWLTSPEALPMLRDQPHATRVLSSQHINDELAGEVFDWILNMEENRDTASLQSRIEHKRWTGVVMRNDQLSYTPDSAPYYDMSLLNADENGGHAAADELKRANRRTYEEIWLSILDAEASAATGPSWVLSETEQAKATDTAQALGLHQLPLRIGINPGAGGRWPSKRLPDETTLMLASSVQDLWGAPLLLLGGPEESGAHAELTKRARGNLINTGTDFSLRDFAALLNLCDVVVSTDSLPLHIANALRVPVVALFGPTSSHEIHLVRGVKLEPPEDCRCFYRSQCESASPCLGEIPITQLIKSIERFFPPRNSKISNGSP